MVDVKNSIVIGGTVPELYVPGAVVLGGSAEQNGNVSVIDLTSPTPDPRITCISPGLRYFNESGALVAAAVNEWPLEYRNGVSVGRHEPEAAALNLITSLKLENITEYLIINGWAARCAKRPA